MSVDPETLQALAVERLTTGPGLDTDFVLSRDEKRLAFTAQSEHFRIWRFPFDAARGRLTGAGHPVTSSGMEAWSHTLTRDGKKLAFVAIRAGRLELWEKSLVDGREGPVVPDDKGRARPVWSPDGMRLAYWRGSDWAEKQLFVWSRDSHREEPVTALSALKRIAYDWSPDGKGLLISEEASDTHLMEIWMLPVAPGAESAAARKIISYPGYDLWQPHFSPNGKWIAFNATRNTPTAAESRLYVTRALGGPNVPITGGKYFDDKPRWSPDGRTIYFASNRAGFYNVWGIRFDPTKGKPVGEPFRVTDFGNPGLMIPGEISQVEISLDHASLFVNLIEASGSIWMLENFD